MAAEMFGFFPGAPWPGEAEGCFVLPWGGSLGRGLRGVCASHSHLQLETVLRPRAFGSCFIPRSCWCLVSPWSVLSDARGESILRCRHRSYTLRLSLPAERRENTLWQKARLQINPTCRERFVLHVFLGLLRRRAGLIARVWTSTRLHFLLLGDVISSHRLWGLAVGMAGTAAPPPAARGAQDAAS